jgi:hypothetical protein
MLRMLQVQAQVPMLQVQVQVPMFRVLVVQVPKLMPLQAQIELQVQL